MNTETIAGVAALVTAVATPLTTWLVARTSRRDKRKSISQDLEILKQLNPNSKIYESLEFRIGKDVDLMILQANRQEAMRPLWANYFIGIGLFLFAAALGWARTQEWLPEEVHTYVTVFRVGFLIVGGFLWTQILYKAATILRVMAPIGWLIAVNQYLKLRFAYGKFTEYRLERKLERLTRESEKLNSRLSEFIEGEVTEAFKRGVPLDLILTALPDEQLENHDKEHIDEIRHLLTIAYEEVAAGRVVGPPAE